MTPLRIRRKAQISPSYSVNASSGQPSSVTVDARKTWQAANSPPDSAAAVLPGGQGERDGSAAFGQRRERRCCQDRRGGQHPAGDAQCDRGDIEPAPSGPGFERPRSRRSTPAVQHQRGRAERQQDPGLAALMNELLSGPNRSAWSGPWTRGPDCRRAPDSRGDSPGHGQGRGVPCASVQTPADYRSSPAAFCRGSSTSSGRGRRVAHRRSTDE